MWVLYFKRAPLILNLYLNTHFSGNIRLLLIWDFNIMLYIPFLSKPLNSRHAALYQSSALNPFIASDHDWGSGDRVLKSDKTNIFYKSAMKDIMCNIFELIRACAYTTCLDLHKQENLFSIILLLSKSALISLTLNTILSFCFSFFSNDKSGDNSIYLYSFKLEYQTDIFHCLTWDTRSR